MTSRPGEHGWDRAPVALLRLDADGAVLDANTTGLGWLGRERDEVVGRPVTDLLVVGGRIYWETHLSPLLHLEGRFDEVALELRVPGGRRSVLVSAVVGPDGTDMALTSAGDRLRFERDLQAARAAARSAERQLAALQQVTAALSEAIGVAGVVDVLLAAVRGPLRAAAGSVWLLGREGRLELAGSTGAGLPAGPPDLEGADGDVLVLSVQGQQGLRGAMVLVPADGPGSDPLDVDVCRAVAQQAGPALDRAGAYEHSASVASELQRALLPAEPPVDPRFEVAAVYRPGVETLEVGGDWWDVFVAADDVLAVVVGDVVGRGLGAATAMGRLSSAVRALASEDLGPGRLLGRLDAFAERTPGAGMATLAYAELHLSTGRFRYACAGHPPPALLSGGVAGRLLWDGRSAPLAALAAPPVRPEAEVVLARGDRVLLVTDGVFERRHRDLDDGLDLLLVAAGRSRHGSPADDVVALTDAMLRDEGVRDDACALLLEFCGDRFRRRVTGALDGLSTARRALDRWLGERGVDPDVRGDLVLAASEAVANAAEHGLAGDRARSVLLEAWVVPGGQEEVVLEVHDDGRWRDGRSDPDRGRGLRIMRALVDDLEVRTEEGTTVRMRRRRELAS